MNKIVIDSGVIQNRAAVIENGELVELIIEGRSSKRVIGNIYKGRVCNILPGMEAAFVDIGLKKNAFLHLKDAISLKDKRKNDYNPEDYNISSVLKNGQDIIVQIIKEPVGTKGARVTTHLAFTGRYTVILPEDTHIGVSRRIESTEEKSRLRGLVEDLLPENMGVILRTEAEGKGIKEIKDDIKYLTKLWIKIDKERNHGFSPKLIHSDLNFVTRVARDIFSSEIEEVYISDEEKHEKLIEFLELTSPELIDRVKLTKNQVNIFEHFGIEKMIEDAMARQVWLESGAYIVIDETEALTVVDVNTGKFIGDFSLDETIIATNMEAAKEIAKQLRLRNIGGILIIDFIDMTNEEHIDRLTKFLEEEFKNDRTKTTIQGFTNLGLMEVSRKKINRRLSGVLSVKCSCCNGTGLVSSEEVIIGDILRELFRIKNHTSSESVVIDVNDKVYAKITSDKEYSIEDIESGLGLNVYINHNKEMHANSFKLVFMGKDKMAKTFIDKK